MICNGHTRAARLFLPLLCTVAVMAAGAQARSAARMPHGQFFDGFRAQFNLGQAGNGAVCEAKRGFDGPVVDKGGRLWNVTCRGWSNTLGVLYVYPGGKARGAEAVWRRLLATRTDCDPTAGVPVAVGVKA